MASFEELAVLNYLSGYDDGNNDRDSLFGGDDDDGDLTSLFTEADPVAAIAPSGELDREPALPLPEERPQQATDRASQLDLPEVRSQPQAQHQPALPFPQLSLPAVPDPLVAPLSHQDGHTSGDNVVSTQDSCSNTSGFGRAPALSEEVPDDAALEAELMGLWEATPNEDQPVNDPAESGPNDAVAIEDSDAVQNEMLIHPTQIPGFRYGNSKTNDFIRLPRRIDLDYKLADELMHYITLNRIIKVDVLYGYLELPVGEGKRLAGEMTKLLKAPPLLQFVQQEVTRSSETKKCLIRVALYMLITQEWGSAWFGDRCPTANSRTYLWPRDSSIILAAFVMLLYRAYSNQRQMHKATLRYNKKLQQAASSDPPPTPSRSPSVAPSDSSPVQPSSVQPSSVQPAPVQPSPVQSSPARPAVNAPQSPPPTPPAPSFFEALAKQASTTKKRKFDESVLGLANPEELEVPANARLKYYVYVKDKTTLTDLALHTTYNHTDFHISCGAFSNLKASFEVAGQQPVIAIQTRFGSRQVTSEEEWENVVLSIYNFRRSGGVVVVDVFI